MNGQDLQEQLSDLRQEIDILLAKGSAWAAYRLADRLCRIAPPSPSDLLARCIAGLGLGWRDAAMRDLDACRAADGFDRTIARFALAASQRADQRLDAARTILRHPESNRREALAAAALLLAADPGAPVVWARRDHDRITGLAAWAGAGPEPALAWMSDTASGSLDLRQSQTRSATVEHGLFSLSAAAEETVAVSADIGPHSASVTLHAQATPSYAADRPTAAAAGGLTIVVPVHSDPAATQACLAALRRQPGLFDVIVVDDHSPDPNVSGAARDFCRATGARHIVNRINLGFAGSVNKALLRAGRGDVLLLNADVVLPDGVLTRLRRAATADDDIGTAMPLSNDSITTSFPIRAAANPPLDRARAADIDRVAARLHGEQAVDLVTNIGFCLYIREPCLRAVGLLSPSYGRGYFEDVEFCLKAEESGFRNVALPGVYVTHAGSRSFTSSKPQLVVRNSAIVHRRFPQYRAELAAEHWADPLRQQRAAIEEQLPPPGRHHLVVRDPAGAGLLPDIPVDGRLELVWEQVAGRVEVKLRAAAGGMPQTLGFQLDQAGARRCRDYLARVEIGHVTVAGIATLPPAVIDLVDSLPASVSASVISRACLARLPAPPAMVGATAASGARTAIPSSWILSAGDAMADGALEARGGRARPKPATRSPVRLPRLTPEHPNLGIVSPRALSDVDRLLRGVARPFVRAGTSRLVVFGHCIDDLSLMRTGAVDVTGPVERHDYAALFSRYRIGAVASPYRTDMFGLFDAVTSECGLPRIYFDWSDGAYQAPDRDCVLDWTLAADAVVAAFAEMPAERSSKASRP